MSGLEDIKLLVERIREEAAEMGLTVVNINLDVDGEILNVVYALSVESIETKDEAEQRSFDEQFEDIFRANELVEEVVPDEVQEKRTEMKETNAKTAAELLEELNRGFKDD